MSKRANELPLPTVPNFRATGDLPSGSTVVLEASAGTGKTYTIASLTARYLAEGKVQLENMMLVTFGRMATQELRDRVRARLVDVERELADPLAATESEDEVVRLLATAERAVVQQRRGRLATALASFDEATIATTHSFCQRMLAGLGIAADNEPDTGLLENPVDLLRQVVDDEYLRRYAGTERPPFDADTAFKLAVDTLGIAQARLEPTDAAEDSPAAERVAFARAVRIAFDLRKRAARVLDFDDLQSRLAEALDHPVRGESARQTLRSAYQVVLVDEFQDTDPVQWQILRSAFHGHSTLVLIGDPKQAIYAFRGADVYTYLAAVETSGELATLGTNWRSDAPLVRALDHLWGGMTLGDKRIEVRRVDAHHTGSRLQVPGGSAPMRIRRLRRFQAEQTAAGLCVSRSARDAVAADMAAEVVELLNSGATIDVAAGADRSDRAGGTDGTDGTAGARPISPSDIAVLVHQNDQGVLIRDALRRLGVPVVLTGNTSVFDSEAAAEWLTLLEALDSPNRAGKARSAALTPFVGWTAEQLAAADAGAIDGLIDLLRDWAQRFTTGGMSALLETVTVTAGIAERILSRTDGDRLLTDIRHVAHAMNAAARTDHLGPAALLEWLRHRVQQALGDAPEELSRRLSSEDAAVQVLTVHRSKGLEFGVVFVPYAWNRWLPDDPDPLRLHDSGGQQVLDVGGPGGPGYNQRMKIHNAETLGEDLRVMYVAFTRARSMLVTWWVPSSNTERSPLNRVLLGTSTHGELPERVSFGQDADVAAAMAERSAASGGLIAIEEADPKRTPKYHRTAVAAPDLAVRTFDRELDTGWRRTSYSGLTKAAHDAHYGALDLLEPATTGGQSPPTGSEPEYPGMVDEPEIPAGSGADSDAGSVADGAVVDGEALLRGIGSPLEDFPGGTAFGTVVHEVLEYLDTDTADLRAELQAHCERVIGSSSGSDVAGELDPAALAAGLEPVFRTPLGAVALDATLASIAPRDRLAEMTFELPLAGGDQPHPESTLADLADVFARYLPAGDLLEGYPELLRDELLAGERLRGYLNGSLDAVLRLTGPDGSPRYLIVDYKTNRLGVPGELLSAWDYRPVAMAEAMMTAHYPLQALLYAVALHRYLRWRQPGYDPAVHLGGALYLFVRGMSGPDTPVVDGMPCGVFTWTPSADLVIAASDVLAGSRR